MLSRILGSVIVVAIACAVPCAAGSGGNPGEWEVTATTEMTGLPMKMPAQAGTYTYCITDDQSVPTPKDKQKECTVSDVKTEAGAVHWKIDCNGKDGKTTGSGKIAYQGDTMTGEQTMTLSGEDGMNIKIETHMTGKRLGPCKAPK